MGLRTRLKIDLDQVFKQISTYEKRLRQAQATSKKQVEAITHQIQKKRLEVEKQVQALVEKEGKKLNARVNTFLNSLLSAANEKKKPKRKPRKRKTTSTKATAPKN